MGFKKKKHEQCFISVRFVTNLALKYIIDILKLTRLTDPRVIEADPRVIEACFILFCRIWPCLI